MAQYRPRTILITNIVSLNPGDAAILQGTLAILRHRYGAGTRVIVFDKRAAVGQAYYPWAEFRQALFANRKGGWLKSLISRCGYGHWIVRLRFFRFLLALHLQKLGLRLAARSLLSANDYRDLVEYATADLILSGGGTYLIENYNLASTIYDLRFSRATGRPYGFFTQSLGPFSSPRPEFKRIFRDAHVILVRDEASRAHLADLMVDDGNVVQAADAAFVLQQHVTPPPDICSSGADARSMSDQVPLPSIEHRLRIAVSVRSLRYFAKDRSIEANYSAAVRAAVRFAIEDLEAEVTFLSTCQGISEYWTDDSATAHAIAADLPKRLQSRFSIDSRFRQPGELVDAFSKFDVVIATRMHAAILALCAGTPTIGIAYEFKLLELFHSLDFASNCVGIDELQADWLCGQLSEMTSRLQHYKSRAILRSSRMRASAWRAADALPEV